MSKPVRFFFVLCGMALFLFSCTAANVKSVSAMTDPKEIYEEGLKLVKDQEYVRSLEYFEAIMFNFSGQPEAEKYIAWATYEMGFVFYRLGDDEKAITYFDQVLASSKVRGPRILADLVKNKILSGNGYKNGTYQ